MSSPCLSLSLTLTSHLAPSFPPPPTPPFILLLSFSHVLQHPRLPSTWLCGQPDRWSPEQRGALGLRQRLQADWKRHSGVQEDHPQLLHLGRPGACLPGWGSLSLFQSFKIPGRGCVFKPCALSSSSHSATRKHRFRSCHVGKSSKSVWLRAGTQSGGKEAEINPLPPTSVNSYFVKLLLANLELVCTVCLLQSGLSQLIEFGVFLGWGVLVHTNDVGIYAFAWLHALSFTAAGKQQMASSVVSFIIRQSKTMWCA